ncbi:MAG: hypothetical protein ACREN3_02710 [Gemmatimonadaceae bacterium]
MPVPLPPYAVVPPAFPFPALAAGAGRAPLGGEREVLLACFVAARLASDTLETGGGAVPPSLRRTRARGARIWLGALAVPGGVRGPVGKLIDATATDDSDGLRHALLAVIGVTAEYLDPASRSDLERLAQALTA